MTDLAWRSRRTPRKANGKIAFGEPPTIYPCTVLDTSLSGARVEVKQVGPLPTNVWLFIEEDRVLADCEIVRRRGKELGLRILSRAPATGPGAALRRPISGQ
jgi:PilZ domain